MRRLPILLLLFPIGACNLQDEPDKPLAAALEPWEDELITIALADTVAREDVCLTATIEPTEYDFWPSDISFGDGKLSYSGDPRYDEAAQSWQAAKPLHSSRVRVPKQVTRQGFRLVHEGSSIPSCREVRTLQLPRFQDDFAFVITDVRWKSFTGSAWEIQIYRRRGNRWESFGFGSTRLGVPVI